jgi:uncharacterized protein YggE
MNKTVAVALLLTLTRFASAQDRTMVQPNTVFAGADGKFEAAPDTATIQFNINAQGDTAKAAYDLAAQQAEQTRQILRSNGIDPKTAEIGYYSLQPQYDWKNPKHKVVGYHVSSTVNVKLKDFSKIGPLTQQLADADLGTGQSLGYSLENMDEAKAKAVDDAFRKARNNAQAIAHASGRTLGELSYASVDTNENVRVFMPMAKQMNVMAAQAPAPTEEFSPQLITVTAHVNAMFNLK